MATNDQQFKIRDLRRKEKYQMDDEYLNGWAKICGWKATLVYMSLCRHADKNQESFPSIQLIAKEHNISPRTAIRGLNNLIEHNIVTVKKIRSKKGTWRNNTYFLIDKTEWIKEYQVSNSHMGYQVTDNPFPSDSQSKNQMTNGHTKDTHKKETHIKEKEINKEKALIPLNGKHSSLTSLGEAEFQQIANDYQVPLSFVMSKFDDLQNYCLSKGKKYKDYLAALRNFVKQDAIKTRKEVNAHVRPAIDASWASKR